MVAKAKPNTYDVIFMDSVMPNMDGPTATVKLRSMGHMGAIYGVTGNAQEAQKEQFLGCGLNNLFTKPVDTEALRNEVLSLLARHRNL